MPTVTNGRLLYVAHPTGFQEPGVHTEYVEEQIDLDNLPLNGGVLVKTMSLSSDTFVRARMRDPKIKIIFPPLALGFPVDNYGVGTVLRSEKPEFKAGDNVVGFLTFESYSVYPGPPELQHGLKFLKKLDKHPDIPASYYLGVLGMPGETAYSAWNAFVQEKAKTSKTLYVSSAAGPVGRYVLEYARVTNPHLKIIASTGSPEKLHLLKESGADVAFNYKTKDVAQVLAENGPIDIFWDHVGGATMDAALANMNFFGLIVRVGTSSGYNSDNASIKNVGDIVLKSLTIHGVVSGFGEAMVKGAVNFVEETTKLVLAGKLSSLEERYDGLKEAGRALADVHTGKSIGKPVIVVAEK